MAVRFFFHFLWFFFHHLMIQRIESEGTLWERLFWHEAQTWSFSVRHVVLMRECAWNRFLVFTVTIQCRRFLKKAKMEWPTFLKWTMACYSLSCYCTRNDFTLSLFNIVQFLFLFRICPQLFARTVSLCNCAPEFFNSKGKIKAF